MVSFLLPLPGNLAELGLGPVPGHPRRDAAPALSPWRLRPGPLPGRPGWLPNVSPTGACRVHFRDLTEAGQGAEKMT